MSHNRDERSPSRFREILSECLRRRKLEPAEYISYTATTQPNGLAEAVGRVSHAIALAFEEAKNVHESQQAADQFAAEYLDNTTLGAGAPRSGAPKPSHLLIYEQKRLFCSAGDGEKPPIPKPESTVNAQGTSATNRSRPPASEWPYVRQRSNVQTTANATSRDGETERVQPHHPQGNPKPLPSSTLENGQRERRIAVDSPSGIGQTSAHGKAPATPASATPCHAAPPRASRSDAARLALDVASRCADGAASAAGARLSTLPENPRKAPCSPVGARFSPYNFPPIVPTNAARLDASNVANGSEKLCVMSHY